MPLLLLLAKELLLLAKELNRIFVVMTVWIFYPQRAPEVPKQPRHNHAHTLAVFWSTASVAVASSAHFRHCICHY